MTARYERFFPDEHFPRVEASGIQALLRKIATLKVACASPEYALDIHIRENCELMVYHGGTCLLTINCSKVRGNAFEKVLFKSPSYGKGKGCDYEFRLLGGEQKVDNLAEVTLRVCDYLAKLIAHPTAIHRKFYQKEGFWSNRLSIEFGRLWRPGMDWLIIDREAVLGFDSKERKDSFYEFKLQTQRIKSNLQAYDPKLWGTPREPAKRKSTFGDELDFLAIGPDKQLLCIELKHGSYTSGIYWGPLQASVYRDAYSRQLDNITAGIKNLVEQKVGLGLLPPEALSMLPEGNFAKVEGVLAIADVDSYLRSTCWEKAIIVNKQLKNPVKMLRSHLDGGGLRWVSSDCW